MAWFKKEGNKLPDIIMTAKFQVANGSRYLGYTERSEAVQDEQQSPEKIFDNDQTGTTQNDPDLPENFQGYLGYTDRKAATKLEHGVHDRYPTFMQNSFNIDEKQHELLEKKLKLAKKNKALLWSTVVSFDPDFLSRINVYNPTTKEVDQRAIKRAIQQAIPELLKKEGLNVPETFWWGDVHLNTNHVHVHIGISQTNNTRPLKENGEPLGMFRQKSIRSMKAKAHQVLIPSRERKKEIELEKELGTIRHDLSHHIEYLVRHDHEQQEYLRQIYWALPNYKDHRKWRSSNHSTSFKEAHYLTDQFVDHVLNTNLKDSYDQFKEGIVAKDQNSRQNYGQKINDTISRQDKSLRELLGNRIYEYMREMDKHSDDRTSIEDQVQTTNPALNKKLIEVEKSQLTNLDPNSYEARLLRKKLGLRRYALRHYNLRQERIYLDQQLQTVLALPNSSPIRNWLEQTLNERLELNILKNLSFGERKQRGLANKYKQLDERYVDVTKVSISQINSDLVKNRKQQLDKELSVILKYSDDPLIDMLLPNTNSSLKLQNAKEFYRISKEVLDLKLKIKQNNQHYGDNKEKRNQANHDLFKTLKRDYRYLQDSDRIDRKIKWEHQFNQHLSNMGNKRENDNPNNRRFRTLSFNKGLQSLIGSLEKDTEQRNRANRQARHQLLDGLDEVEKEDRENDQEIERRR